MAEFSWDGINRSGPCCFCGRVIGQYHSKLVELPRGERIVCQAQFFADKIIPGCDSGAFADMPEEERKRFASYSDG